MLFCCKLSFKTAFACLLIHTHKQTQTHKHTHCMFPPLIYCKIFQSACEKCSTSKLDLTWPADLLLGQSTLRGAAAHLVMAHFTLSELVCVITRGIAKKPGGSPLKSIWIQESGQSVN